MTKLAFWKPGGLETMYHWCPACEELHVLPLDRGWTMTGTVERPTLSPSFLQHDKPPKYRCHYFITDGNLLFLPDSWHKRNDTVPMPDIPSELLDGYGDVTSEAIFGP